jgi:hypothetical protein
MKPVLAKTLFAVALLTNLSTFAQGLNAQLSKANGSLSKGGVATGGGDLCEDRIQGIRDDLKSWILSGGAVSLELPDGLTTEKYDKKVLKQIRSAQVHCVGSGDVGYPVEVSGVPKVCRFDRGTDKTTITCDYKKFQEMNSSDQYVLIHHEYAGLAKIERPDDAVSNYMVSNQISEFLIPVSVEKLAIKYVGRNFKLVPTEKLEAYKKSIPWLNTTYQTYLQSESWDALQYLRVEGLTPDAEEIVNRAQSAKVSFSGSKAILVFEFKAKDVLKYTTALTLEGNQIVSVRSEMQSLAASWPDPKNPSVSVEGWKTIGWEMFY